jgi:hypothetical protein
MSLLFIDGFDHYPSIRRKYQVSAALENPDFVAGRFGGKAIRKQFQNGTGTNTRSFGQQSEIFFGIAYFPPQFPGNTQSMWRLLDTPGNIICSVNITSGGILSIVAGGQSATSLTALPTAQWSYIEVHYTAKDSGGVAQLKVDAAVVATITGDTTTGAEDDITGFQLLDNGTNSPRYLLDDLYILNGSGTENNNYLGDVRITTLYAKADGNDNNWAALSEVENYLEVDEVSLDSTTYVESGIVGAAEDYNNQGFDDAAVTPGTIYGVQTSNATLRTNAGSITHNNTMTVAGIDYTDAAGIVAGAGNYFIDCYIRDTDPSDNATWTEQKVDDVGSGIVIIAKEV